MPQAYYKLFFLSVLLASDTKLKNSGYDEEGREVGGARTALLFICPLFKGITDSNTRGLCSYTHVLLLRLN